MNDSSSVDNTSDEFYDNALTPVSDLSRSLSSDGFLDSFSNSSVTTVSLARCLLMNTPPGLKKQSSATIWSLPPEIIEEILEYLHISDLLSVIQVHPSLKAIVDTSCTLWKYVSFYKIWPSRRNLDHFETAVMHENTEAMIKLGVAYLYNEGLVNENNLLESFSERQRVTANGDKAAELFCKVESILGKPGSLTEGRSVAPFTWIFIRPPWSSNGQCCKERVFGRMVDFSDRNKAPTVHLCIARTLEVLNAEDYKKVIQEQLTNAANLGSSLAKYILWDRKYFSIFKKSLGHVEELKALRSLRDIARCGEPMARLSLCRLYGAGCYGGYTQRQARNCVRSFIQAAGKLDVRNVFSQSNELSQSMRYILVDWLVEVASMKKYDSTTVHTAVSVMDRFLLKRPVQRCMLQLLGVTALVLCSRLMGRDIITISEAAWLTDSTYRYDEVVRMMGEITGVLQGNFRVLHSLDYVILLGRLSQCDAQCQYLCEYLCELSLLHAELSCYSHSHIAAACVLLARLTLKREYPWSSTMIEMTGFTVSDLSHSIQVLQLIRLVTQVKQKYKRTLYMLRVRGFIVQHCLHLNSFNHNYALECRNTHFMEKTVTDHRNIPLNSVIQRYSDLAFMSVSNIKIPSARRLISVLGLVPQPSTPLKPLSSLDACSTVNSESSSYDSRNLIASPSRSGKSPSRSFSDSVPPTRDDTATPTPVNQPSSVSDWSTTSVNQPSSVSDWSATPVNQPSSVSDWSATLVNQPSSVSDWSATPVNQPSSVSDWSATPVNQPSSVSNWSLSTEYPSQNVRFSSSLDADSQNSVFTNSGYEVDKEEDEQDKELDRVGQLERGVRPEAPERENGEDWCNITAADCRRDSEIMLSIEDSLNSSPSYNCESSCTSCECNKIRDCFEELGDNTEQENIEFVNKDKIRDKNLDGRSRHGGVLCEGTLERMDEVRGMKGSGKENATDKPKNCCEYMRKHREPNQSGVLLERCDQNLQHDGDNKRTNNNDSDNIRPITKDEIDNDDDNKMTKDELIEGRNRKEGDGRVRVRCKRTGEELKGNLDKSGRFKY